jgi:hypothetical protein
MKKHRSISYYARREKLRESLAIAKRHRKAKPDAPQPANENRPADAEAAAPIDSRREPHRVARDDRALPELGPASPSPAGAPSS